MTGIVQEHESYVLEKAALIGVNVYAIFGVWFTFAIFDKIRAAAKEITGCTSIRVSPHKANTETETQSNTPSETEITKT